MSNIPIVKDDISSHIYTIRGVQVMLDEDLAILYQVKTKVLNQTVKRNVARFPDQFCFKLDKSEYSNLKSQFVTSSLRSQIATSNYGGRRKLPHVFTEQGVAMLSGVLKSDVAIHMSIQIMTAFVSMRRVLQTNSLVFSRLDNLEHKQLETDKKFDQVFDALSSKDKIPDHKIFFDGQVFDAHKFVSNLIRSAKKEIILIDNFVDDSVLDLLTKRHKNVVVIIYTKSISSSFALDIKKFNTQYPPLTVKELNTIHDRFLIIDQSTTYHFGASIKDLGKKLFAVSKLSRASLKILNSLS